MTWRRAMHLDLAILLAAGFGLCAPSTFAAGPGTAASKPATSAGKTSGKTTHRSSKKVGSRRKEKGQTAPTPERISEIQEALAKDGSFNSTPSGKWDETTAAAMKRFQSGHALNPSGKLDARTLEKLGLGSQTAGIAEPVAPPNSTSRLSGPSLESSRP